LISDVMVEDFRTKFKFLAEIGMFT